MWIAGSGVTDSIRSLQRGRADGGSYRVRVVFFLAELASCIAAAMKAISMTVSVVVDDVIPADGVDAAWEDAR